MSTKEPSFNYGVEGKATLTQAELDVLDDLVIINFGGNDLTLPSEEGVAPEEAAQRSRSFR